jgi:hypothetical protein
MPYTDQVLVSGSAWREAEHLHLSLGLPWFRSVPLSNVDFSVTVGQKQLNQSDIEVLAHGVWGPLAARQMDETVEWFLQDRLQLRTSHVSVEANPVSVQIAFQLKTPNLFVAPGEPIVVPLRVAHNFSL